MYSMYAGIVDSLPSSYFDKPQLFFSVQCRVRQMCCVYAFDFHLIAPNQDTALSF